MSRTEVTKGEYAKGRGSSISSAEGDVPAADVDWQDAKRYCSAVGGRLPTENEWEYAARAGSTSSRYDVLADIGWYADNSDDHVHPVAQKTANTFGLFDMLGNVYEWVADRYFNAYDEEDSGSVVEPLAGNASGVARGGGFESPAKDLRASNRWGVPPDMAQAVNSTASEFVKYMQPVERDSLRLVVQKFIEDGAKDRDRAVTEIRNEIRLLARTLSVIADRER